MAVVGLTTGALEQAVVGGEAATATTAAASSSFLPVIGLGLQAFSSISTAFAIRDTARLNAFIASKNAELADIKARVVRKESDIAEAFTRKKGKELISAQRAVIGTTGITAESFEKVVEQTAFEAELGALAVRYRGLVREGDVRAKAGRARLETVTQKGKARRAGFEALLSGLGSSIEIVQELKRQGIIGKK